MAPTFENLEEKYNCGPTVIIGVTVTTSTTYYNGFMRCPCLSEQAFAEETIKRFTVDNPVFLKQKPGLLVYTSLNKYWDSLVPVL